MPETIPGETIEEPTAPRVEAESVITQYGIQYPDLTIDWADADGNISIKGSAYTTFNLKNPSTELSQLIAQRGTAAKLDPSMYVNSHGIVTRTVTTLVSEPILAGNLEALL